MKTKPLFVGVSPSVKSHAATLWLAAAGCVLTGGYAALHGSAWFAAVCPTTCAQVAQAARHAAMLNIVGFAFFGLCGVLSALRIESAWDVLLPAAAAAEGLFVGYQIFSVQTLCPYCLVVAGLVAALAWTCGRQHAPRYLAAFTGALCAVWLVVGATPAEQIARMFD